jgi:hypothetical protein
MLVEIILFNDDGHLNQSHFILNGGKQNRVGNRQGRGREAKREVD